MGSATRRRGAYGGEYLRAGLRLRARGGRRLGKRTSQTRARKGYRQKLRRLISNSEKSPKPHPSRVPFYRQPISLFRGVHIAINLIDLNTLPCVERKQTFAKHAAWRRPLAIALASWCSRPGLARRPGEAAFRPPGRSKAPGPEQPAQPASGAGAHGLPTRPTRKAQREPATLARAWPI
jgi:hypothetical protein